MAARAPEQPPGSAGPHASGLERSGAVWAVSASEQLLANGVDPAPPRGQPGPGPGASDAGGAVSTTSSMETKADEDRAAVKAVLSEMEAAVHSARAVTAKWAPGFRRPALIYKERLRS